MLEFVFNKVAGLQSCNLIKKRLQHRCFPVNSAKFLKTSFSQKTFRRLLLTAALLFCRSILMEERQQYYIHLFTDFIHKTFTPDIFRKYSKKQTPNMSILQFSNVKPKQDLNKTLYLVDFIATLRLKSTKYTVI